MKLVDIARLAGVSPAAVSAAINCRSQVSVATRDRIMALVKQYDYVPQSSARALSGHRTYQIGFLVSCKVTLGLANSYFATLMAGVHEVCKQRNYHLLVSTYDLSDIDNFIMPTNIRQRNIDGLVMAGATSLEVIRQIQKAGIPFVVVGGDYPDDVLNIRQDMETTAENLLRYFFSLGHRRLYVPYYYSVTKSIFNTARQRFSSSGETPEAPEVQLAYWPGDNEFEDGEKAAEQWLGLPESERFTALYGNDQFAIGFLRRFIASGRRCPDDISIIASDTIISRNGIFPLTTCASEAFELGQAAVDSLLSLIEKTRCFSEVRTDLHKMYHPAEILPGSSTGPIPRWAAKLSPH